MKHTESIKGTGSRSDVADFGDIFDALDDAGGVLGVVQQVPVPQGAEGEAGGKTSYGDRNRVRIGSQQDMSFPSSHARSSSAAEAPIGALSGSASVSRVLERVERAVDASGPFGVFAGVGGEFGASKLVLDAAAELGSRHNSGSGSVSSEVRGANADGVAAEIAAMLGLFASGDDSEDA